LQDNLHKANDILWITHVMKEEICDAEFTSSFITSKNAFTGIIITDTGTENTKFRFYL